MATDPKIDEKQGKHDTEGRPVFSNRCVIADREDPGTIERHCLGGGLRRIFGP
jgi:hypothetical protein